MSAAAEAHPHGGHHGPPTPHYSSRVSPATLGILLFIGSEIMLFGSFFTVYFFIRVVNSSFWGGQWPPSPYQLPAFVAGVNTLLLVTSSFSMHWADSSIKKGNRAGMQAGLVLTFALGLSFLIIQLIEYSRIGFNTSDTAFAATFYGLTGLHGAHVFIGLTILMVMIVRAFRGHFSEENHKGIELGGIYWHFVDVMWIVVYLTVYII
jgi:cytochrome c oxidase subunit III